MKFVIIGSGIIANTISLEIQKRRLGEVSIIDKEPFSGLHSSSRNSGVVHSGINHTPGSLKAKMCLVGNKVLRDYCINNDIPLNQCGTLVVGELNNSDKIKILYRMGTQIGVPELKIINRDNLLKLEPNAAGSIGLLSPTGATVDAIELLNTIEKESKSYGTEYHMNQEIIHINKNSNTITTKKDKFEADHIINCAGLYCDKIAHMMDIGKNYTIIPFRGEYMEAKNVDINSMIYQVPDLRYPFLSIHLTKSTNGMVIAGPTATLSFGRESYNKEINLRETISMVSDYKFLKLILSKEFLKLIYSNAKVSLSRKAFLHEVQKLYTPRIDIADLLPYRSGIRPQIVDGKGKMIKDTLVIFNNNCTHILNAVSPGLTTSFAFAKYLVEKIEHSRTNI